MSDLKVLILGPTCTACNQLAANVRAAVAELGYVARVDHVRDYAGIAALGVARTPALVVNGAVLAVGRVPSAAEVRDLLASTPAR